MAGARNTERLQPSLLDRLTDNQRDKTSESSDSAVINMRELRRCVMRDIAWLLNTGNLASVLDLDDYPEILTSVLNYGMPDLAGMAISSMDMPSLERTLHKAIANFEPRIDARSLSVKIRVARDRMHRNALTLDIEGDLWAKPTPLRLFLKTELDLESGDIAVTDASGRG